VIDPSPPSEGDRIEPIRLTAAVRRPIADAFRLFTEDWGSWFPVQTHHARGPVVGVVFEGRPGGRLLEVCADGVTVCFGEVMVWEPPHRVAFTWHPSVLSTIPTEIEVRFFSEGKSVTRVELEHRGWERLGREAHEQRTAYLNGWPAVWAQFLEAAGT
jgi:uncharacterized protein YndB with AHSA1/START domain